MDGWAEHDEATALIDRLNAFGNDWANVVMVPCKRCGAGIGRACKVKRGGGASHAPRTDAWLRMRARCPTYLSHELGLFRDVVLFGGSRLGYGPGCNPSAVMKRLRASDLYRAMTASEGK